MKKGGHWDQYILNSCINLDIQKLKHYQNDDNDAWAERIYGKIVQEY
ncbi:hypothetical protein ABE504_31480 [Paenibacillus oryzisoli]